jgi:IPT/TIG domain/WD40-like Beta Propeller Repeat
MVTGGERRVGRLLCGVGLVAAAALASPPAAPAESFGPFSDPQPVTIEGYAGSAEEPFISADGRFLLFNSLESEQHFSLRFAEGSGGQTFAYGGELRGEGVNDPESLSGAPTMDAAGTVYFISPRSYFQTLSSVYRGQFHEGELSGVHLIEGVSAPMLGKVDFDVGASPDGSALYVSEGQFGQAGGPSSARLVIFERQGNSFAADPLSETLLKSVNAVAALVYAADLSYDELELFFTAANPAVGQAPAIYRATRASTAAPFGDVQRIAAISGFAEAPALSADGTTLYYHEQAGSEFHTMTVRRQEFAPAIEKLRPAKGAAAGGTEVSISGANFTGVAAVRFGSQPAARFAVNSPTSLTAVAPAASRGRVDVRVTTPGGTSASTRKDRFRYGR